MREGRFCRLQKLRKIYVLKMNTINFQNKEFKIRKIELPEFGNVFISVISLNELLLNKNGGYISEEANIIDEQIFYYVDDFEIEFDDEVLIKLIKLEVTC